VVPAASVAPTLPLNGIGEYGKKLSFEDFRKDENRGVSSLLANTSESSRNSASSGKEEMIKGHDGNDIMFVANPRYSFTRRLIRAKPKLFDFGTQRDSHLASEKFAAESTTFPLNKGAITKEQFLQ